MKWANSALLLLLFFSTTFFCSLSLPIFCDTLLTHLHVYTHTWIKHSRCLCFPSCLSVAFRRGCEPVWHQIHQTDTSGQPRRHQAQPQCWARLRCEIHFHICLLFLSSYGGSKAHSLLELKPQTSVSHPGMSQRLLQCTAALCCVNELSKHVTCMCLTVPQGFTYVAPSVLESLKEGFSFEPRTRPVRRHNSSPRTPIR